MLGNCIGMLVLGTIWKTRHSVVGQQNLQEQSQNGLRQTIGKIDFMHSFTQVTSDNMWATLLSIVDWLYFTTLTLLETLRTKNLLLGEFYEDSEAQHFSPSVGCAISRHQYPYSSTESEIISLDAGLRMDGLPALDLLDFVIEVLRWRTTIKEKVIQLAQGDLCRPLKIQKSNVLK